MTEIIAGMTPVEFITAMNDNFTDVVVSSTILLDSMIGTELQTTLNNNFDKSDIYVGRSGYITKLNSNFAEHDVSLDAPSNLVLNWIEDYLQITFNESAGNQCEVWEQVNDGDYILAHTLDSGIESDDYKTWQNADLNFRIRAKNGSYYSSFTDIVNTATPIILRTDQTTLHTIFIEHLRVLTGFTINIDWGDDTNNDYTGVTEITKDYETEGDYWITISGDTDDIDMIDWPCTGEVIYGDLTKMIMPSAMVMWHFYSHSLLTGDVSDWVFPDNISVFHIGGCDYYGSVNNWVLSPVLHDFHISANRLTGNPMLWNIPDTMAHFDIGNNGFVTDVTELVMPNSSVYPSVILDLHSNEGITGDVSAFTMDAGQIEFSIHYTNVVGDLSGCTIPASEVILGGIGIRADGGPQITKMPRGNFRLVDIFNFQDNACDSDEIDSLLAAVDDCFVDEVVPLTDCTYTLDGTGMGIPSAAGLTSKTSIEGKYTTAGFTATIYVNS